MNRVLWKSSQYSDPLSYLSSPTNNQVLIIWGSGRGLFVCCGLDKVPVLEAWSTVYDMRGDVTFKRWELLGKVCVWDATLGEEMMLVSWSHFPPEQPLESKVSCVLSPFNTHPGLFLFCSNVETQTRWLSDATLIGLCSVPASKVCVCMCVCRETLLLNYLPSVLGCRNSVQYLESK